MRAGARALMRVHRLSVRGPFQPFAAITAAETWYAACMQQQLLRSQSFATRRKAERDERADDRAILNFDIPASEVMVISADGENLGVMSLDDAVSIAKKEGLDLAPVALSAKPIVCRILDYGKTKYEKKQKKKQVKQKVAANKEIKFRPDIGEHDLDVKINQIRRFLEKGHNVTVTLNWKKQQQGRIAQGEQILQLVADELADVGTWNNEQKRSGNRIEIRLAPTAKPN